MTSCGSKCGTRWKTETARTTSVERGGGNEGTVETTVTAIIVTVNNHETTAKVVMVTVGHRSDLTGRRGGSTNETTVSAGARTIDIGTINTRCPKAELGGTAIAPRRSVERSTPQ